MGASQSRFEVLDCAENRNLSIEHKISEWTVFPPKNSEYYDGTRFFKVPRHLYPQYTKGIFYGYNESIDWHKNYNYNINYIE